MSTTPTKHSRLRCTLVCVWGVVLAMLTGCAGLPAVQMNVQVGLVNVNEYDSGAATDNPYKANMPWVDSGGDAEMDAPLTNEGMENSLEPKL